MFEKCIYFNSNAFVRHLNRIWDEAYKPMGLSAPHAYVLRLVCHEPGIGQTELGEQLHLEKSTVTRFISVLEDKGLLRRQAGNSGRGVSLKATAAGKRLGKQLDQTGTDLYKQLRKQFGADQFEALVKSIRAGIGSLS